MPREKHMLSVTFCIHIGSKQVGMFVQRNNNINPRQETPDRDREPGATRDQTRVEVRQSYRLDWRSSGDTWFVETWHGFFVQSSSYLPCLLSDALYAIS